MTDDKVIHIYDWQRPLKHGEPLCAMPMEVRLRNGWGYFDLTHHPRGGCFRRLTEDVTLIVERIIGNELYGRLLDGRRICIDNRAVIKPEAYQKGDRRVLTILARCKRLQFLIVAGIVTLIAMALA